MKFNQYIYMLLVAGSALVALIALIASGSRGFLFLSLSIHRHPWPNSVCHYIPNHERSCHFLYSGKCIRFWF
ncbi:Uncharacterised protein [Enterobacter cloacae]|nr:Uncharacterised protein [Enterobacter cloacae]